MEETESMSTDAYAVMRRTETRLAMRRLRAKRHAQGLTSHGTERVRKENREVLCENLKRAWEDEFK